MILDIIREIPLFSNLPPGEIEGLGEKLEECEFDAGRILFTEDSLTEHFYFILDGQVEIIKALGTVDERVVATSPSGSILGEMSMFSRRGRHTASARTHTPARLLKIAFSEFDELLHRHPELAYDLLRLYSRRLEESESLTIQDLREKNRQLTKAYFELQAAQAAMIEKERLERELQIAAAIQRDILPESLPAVRGFDFGALMIPARLVGGDFFDFIELDNQRLAVVVGDVCDKGVPAALFMALTYSSVRAESQRYARPGDLLQAVNRHLLEINRSDMFVTLLYGILDCRSGDFAYARAGHPGPLLLDAAGQPVALPSGLGQPLGLFEGPVIDEQFVSLPPGGLLLAFSDGLSETVEEMDDSPQLQQFCAGLLPQCGPGAQAVCDCLWETVGGSESESRIKDDFTVVALRNTGAV